MLKANIAFTWPAEALQIQQAVDCRRIKALESYRHMLQSTSEPIDLFKAALLIAKHRYPLLVNSPLLQPVRTVTLLCAHTYMRIHSRLLLFCHIRVSCTTRLAMCLHISVQDEAKCESILDEHVAKVRESLPSESSQPGSELVYITRSPLNLLGCQACCLHEL